MYSKIVKMQEDLHNVLKNVKQRLLRNDVTGLTNERVIQEARQWLGTKFIQNSFIKGHGCDCAGLIVGIAKNIDFYRYDDLLSAYITKKGDKISEILVPINIIDVGMIIQISLPRIVHFAIVSGVSDNKNGQRKISKIIHADENANCVIEHIISEKLMKYITMFFNL